MCLGAGLALKRPSALSSSYAAPPTHARYLHASSTQRLHVHSCALTSPLGEHSRIVFLDAATDILFTSSGHDCSRLGSESVPLTSSCVSRSRLGHRLCRQARRVPFTHRVFLCANAVRSPYRPFQLLNRRQCRPIKYHIASFAVAHSTSEYQHHVLIRISLSISVDLNLVMEIIDV
jgi:hypothetical protein